jgi:beta-aspartyl-peptidase (threonine type)
VYGWIEDGMGLEAALKRGIDLFDPAVAVGLIAVTGTDAAAWSNRDMPQTILKQD